MKVLAFAPRLDQPGANQLLDMMGDGPLRHGELPPQPLAGTLFLAGNSLEQRHAPGIGQRFGDELESLGGQSGPADDSSHSSSINIELLPGVKSATETQAARDRISLTGPRRSCDLIETERTMDFRTLTLTLLRVIPTLLYMEHGAQKLFGALGGFGPSGGTAPLFSQMGLAGVIEFFGGLLVVLGLFTRPVAALMFCEMMVAYAQAHAPQGFWPILNHGELPLTFGFIFLFFAAHGSGPISLDARLFSRGAAARLPQPA
jgi:putative oxidoreductase